jgi:RNA polymerase sigma-70 factor (ECF subfamily)
LTIERYFGYVGGMNPQPFEGFYHTYVKRVYRFVFYRVGGRVELTQDLTQEIFLKAFEAFDRYDPTKSQSAWIYTIARNHLINHHAKQRPQVDVEDVIDSRLVSEDGREVFARADDDQRLLRGIDGLDTDDARLVRMKYLEGWGFDELADMLGKSSGALRVQAGRALKKLRHSLHKK